MNAESPNAREWSIIQDYLRGSGRTLLAKADEIGLPHATRLATVILTEEMESTALTSPDSRKVSTIPGNPKVKWLT